LNSPTADSEPRSHRTIGVASHVQGLADNQHCTPARPTSTVGSFMRRCCSICCRSATPILWMASTFLVPSAVPPCAQHATSDGVCSIAFARTPVSWDGGASHSAMNISRCVHSRQRAAKGPLVKAGLSRLSIQLRRLSPDRRWPQFSAEADSALVQL